MEPVVILFLQTLLLVWVQDGTEDGIHPTYTGYEFTPILYSSSSTSFSAAAPDLCLRNWGQNQVPAPSLLPSSSSGAAVPGQVCLLWPCLFCLAFPKSVVLVTHTECSLWLHLHQPAEEGQDMVSGTSILTDGSLSALILLFDRLWFSLQCPDTAQSKASVRTVCMGLLFSGQTQRELQHVDVGCVTLLD